jgi:hypothetical protein
MTANEMSRQSWWLWVKSPIGMTENEMSRQSWWLWVKSPIGMTENKMSRQSWWLWVRINAEDGNAKQWQSRHLVRSPFGMTGKLSVAGNPSNKAYYQ